MAKLKEVCTFYSGTGFPTKYQGNDEGEYAFYKVSDIANNVQLGNTYLSVCNNYISGEIAKEIKGCILPKDTVVFAKIGEAVKLNRRAITSADCLIDNNAMGLAPIQDKLRLDYFFYYMRNLKMEKLAESTTVPSVRKSLLEELEIKVPSLEEQKEIGEILDKVSVVIQTRKQEIEQLDLLIKARFVEMFGDPITNSKLLPIEKIEERYFLKAGITTKAEDIHDYLKDKYEIPCYGGNGIRGYVENLSYEGCYPIIGRQGALCGNVQYATGKFHATEHAVLVSTLKNDNTMWVYYMLKLMDLYRYHTGAAQPGLAVKKLNTIDVIVADINLQNQFAAFVHQINKSKFVIHKFLYCTTHNTKSIIKPRPNTKESGKIRGRETTCRRILTF